AIYATRTLENPTDRGLTGLLVPVMSCGARLPGYVLIASIFFPTYSTVAVLTMYIIGIIMALIAGILLRKTLFKGAAESSLLIEIPAYHMPTLRNVWTEMWQRTRAFLEGAATIIMSVSIIIWLLMAIPVSGEGHFTDTPVDDSAFAHLAGAISPAFKPLGFGNWQNASALITGFIAKEVVVSTMAQVYHSPQEQGPGEEDTGFWAQGKESVVGLAQAVIDTLKTIPSIIGVNLFPPQTESEPPALMTAIRQGFDQSSGGFGALAAFAFMVYVLLYSPCVATMAAQRQELGARWMWTSIAMQLSLGWLLALLVFQGGKLLLG
ncbi:MAG: ferrous iron transport protein B, partial [Clostridia bacterium]